MTGAAKKPWCDLDGDGDGDGDGLQELEEITASLKTEMVRVMKSRRSDMARIVSEFCRLSARQARTRKEQWLELARTLADNDEEALAAARRRVVSYAKRERGAGAAGVAETREQRRTDAGAAVPAAATTTSSGSGRESFASSGAAAARPAVAAYAEEGDAFDAAVPAKSDEEGTFA